MNFLHEITLVKHFTSDISLFKWELAHLYSYINVFSTEIALSFSTFSINFGSKYLILFNKNVSEGVPGQFVLYQRFFSEYSLDMEDFDQYKAFDKIIDFHFNSRKRLITVVGLAKDQIIRMRFGLRSFRIEFQEPQRFLDQQIPFEFEFHNGNTFKLQFRFINTHLLATTSDNTRAILHYFLIALVVFCFVAIFALLIVTVFLSKRKEELIIQLDLGAPVDDEPPSQGSFRVSSMRITRRIT